MKKQKKAFSIIVAIFVTGFLMILTIGVLNLVLREMKDNKGAENYYKAYAGVEGAMELGLLKIKQNSYSYDEDLLKNSSGAEILSFNSSFNKNKDPKISYKMEIKTNKIDKGIIGTGSESTVIIPLFWQNDNSFGNTTEIELKNITLDDGITDAKNDIIWNIIGGDGGVSGTGTFNKSKNQTFLSDTKNKKSYLVLFNKNPTKKIKYDLEAKPGEYFSNPSGVITSSVQVGKYKQNITTNIDNTKFLKMLKYSLYNK